MHKIEKIILQVNDATQCHPQHSLFFNAGQEHGQLYLTLLIMK